MIRYRNGNAVVIKVMRRDQKGFTLPEMLVAAGLSLAVMASIYGLFRSQTHTIKGQESRMEAHEYALAVLDMMVREIRNTGYFPTGTACANVANTGGIVATPTADSFRLVYDTNGDGTCEEDVAFTFDSVNRNILRNGSAVTSGNAAVVQFTFYPQQTSSAAPAPFCFSTGNPSGCSGNLSANLNAVQKIMISLTVQATSPDVQFGGQSTVTMSSSVDLRNHGLPS